MKAINEKSTAIFLSIVEKLKDNYLKIENDKGCYMPLSVEKIGEIENFELISMCHYYEQNGDLMADPEMCFLLNREKRSVIPYYYKNDGVGFEQQSIEFDSKVTGIRVRMQCDHVLFANAWLKNLVQQQFI